MNSLNQFLSITSISIVLGLTLIFGMNTRINTESQLDVISLPKIPHHKTDQPFVVPNRGTIPASAGGGIRSFYWQSQHQKIRIA